MSAFGLDKFKEAIKRIDQSLGPKGPLYAIYKRDPSGRNKRLFWGLTFKEAVHKKLTLNAIAAQKRDKRRTEKRDNGLEYIPEVHELILYDMVEMGTEQENPYWNPLAIIKE